MAWGFLAPASVIVATPAHTSPPLESDDPEIPPAAGCEINLPVTLEHEARGVFLDVPPADINELTLCVEVGGEVYGSSRSDWDERSSFAFNPGGISQRRGDTG